MGPEQLVFLWMIIMTLAICALVFGLRYMRNREYMAMIEKGMNPKLREYRPRPAPFVNLKWGLLITGAGIGLLAAYLLDNTLLYKIGHDADGLNGANTSIYFALIAIGGGLGLILSYRVEKKELLDKEKLEMPTGQ